MHLQSISNFRAFAIILIVAGHTVSFGLSGEDVFSSAIIDFVTGNTTLFVFISGFMFHYVFYKNFNYRKFVIDKLKNVGLPYFILSSVIIFLYFILGKGYFNEVEMLQNPSNYFPEGILGKIFMVGDSDFIVTLKYFFVGAPVAAYWYIPFALLLFLCSPLHVKFIELNKSLRIYTLIILMLFALLAHRPEFRNPLLNLLYFTPVYLLGIICSIHKETILPFLKSRLFFIALFFVFSFFLILQIYFLEKVHGKFFFEIKGFDFILIGKLLLVFLIWSFLERCYFNIKLLNIVSNTSFSIFFIHGWILRMLKNLRANYFSHSEIQYLTENNFYFIYFIVFFVVLSLSVVISLLIKRMFNYSKVSRYFIGY